MTRLIIRNAKQVVLVCKNGERILKGEAMKSVAVMDSNKNSGLSVVANDGKIECIDYDSQIQNKYRGQSFDTEINATGMCVLPGTFLLEICACIHHSNGGDMCIFG